MTRTHFVNVNGLPEEGQITTARDLAKLTRAIIVEFPEYYGPAPSPTSSILLPSGSAKPAS